MRGERAARTSFWRRFKRFLAGYGGGDRARELLLACLTPAQRAEFQRSRSFAVVGASGRRYRVTYGTAINIEVLGASDEVRYRLCAGPLRLSAPATMLAQKLMLETREAEFLSIAARHPAPPPLG